MPEIRTPERRPSHPRLRGHAVRVVVVAGLLAAGAAAGGLARPVVDPISAFDLRIGPVAVDNAARERVRGDVRDAMNAMLAVAQRLNDDAVRRIALRGIDSTDVMTAAALDVLVVADADANDLRLAAWELANAVGAVEGAPASPAFAQAGVDARALDARTTMAAARLVAEARLFAASTRALTLQTNVGTIEADHRAIGGNAAVAGLLADLVEAAGDAIDARFAASRAMFADEAAALAIVRLDELQALVASMNAVPAGADDDVAGVADALDAIERRQAELAEALESLGEFVRERLPASPAADAAAPSRGGGGPGGGGGSERGPGAADPARGDLRP